MPYPDIDASQGFGPTSRFTFDMPLVMQIYFFGALAELTDRENWTENGDADIDTIVSSFAYVIERARGII